MKNNSKNFTVPGTALFLVVLTTAVSGPAVAASDVSQVVEPRVQGVRSNDQTGTVGEFLSVVQTEWAQIYYSTMSKKEKLAALDGLGMKIQTMSQAQPDSVEFIIWRGITLATRAGVDGSMSALKTVKAARRHFETALQMDEYALDGSAHLSLGSLYYQVPPWPIAFGSKKKAAYHLKKALEINPAGIDSNFFYAGYLEETGDLRGALKALRIALEASPRPGREEADAGRRSEILVAIDRIKKKTLSG